MSFLNFPHSSRVTPTNDLFTERDKNGTPRKTVTDDDLTTMSLLNFAQYSSRVASEFFMESEEEGDTPRKTNTTTQESTTVPLLNFATQSPPSSCSAPYKLFSEENNGNCPFPEVSPNPTQSPLSSRSTPYKLFNAENNGKSPFTEVSPTASLLNFPTQTSHVSPNNLFTEGKSSAVKITEVPSDELLVFEDPSTEHSSSAVLPSIFENSEDYDGDEEEYDEDDEEDDGSDNEAEDIDVSEPPTTTPAIFQNPTEHHYHSDGFVNCLVTQTANNKKFNFYFIQKNGERSTSPIMVAHPPKKKGILNSKKKQLQIFDAVPGSSEPRSLLGKLKPDKKKSDTMSLWNSSDVFELPSQVAVFMLCPPRKKQKSISSKMQKSNNRDDDCPISEVAFCRGSSCGDLLQRTTAGMKYANVTIKDCIKKYPEELPHCNIMIFDKKTTQLKGGDNNGDDFLGMITKNKNTVQLSYRAPLNAFQAFGFVLARWNSRGGIGA